MTVQSSMPGWHSFPIFTRDDGSYIISMDNNPYHVPPDLPEFAELWAEVDAFARANPTLVQPEPGPPASTLEEAQAAKMWEIAQGYDSALVATLTMPEAGPSPAETAVQAALFAAEDSAGLSDVLGILAARRAELETAVGIASTVDGVRAVAVTYPV